jgi:hypothetical protein
MKRKEKHKTKTKNFLQKNENFSQSFWSGDASWVSPTKGFTSVAL